MWDKSSDRYAEPDATARLEKLSVIDSLPITDVNKAAAPETFQKQKKKKDKHLFVSVFFHSRSSPT